MVEAVELELSLFFRPEPVWVTLRTVSDRFRVLEEDFCAASTSEGSMDVRDRAARTSLGLIEVYDLIPRVLDSEYKSGWAFKGSCSLLCCFNTSTPKIKRVLNEETFMLTFQR